MVLNVWNDESPYRECPSCKKKLDLRKLMEKRHFRLCFALDEKSDIVQLVADLETANSGIAITLKTKMQEFLTKLEELSQTKNISGSELNV